MNWSILFRKKTILQITQETTPQVQLHKTLKVWDLTALGVAAILGAGIFSTIGNAAANGGPAVIFLFLFTAIACSFSALCYAELASTIPIAGSAYTYAYAAFGEFLAWIIGWDLLMEYAIGNIAMAISWSQYFTGFLLSHRIHIPAYLTTNFPNAYRAYQLIAYPSHTLITPENLRNAHAWQEAPRIFGIPMIFDFPALLIVLIITTIAYRGIEESKKASNILVIIKIAVILLVISVGSFYVQPEHWHPFAPNGVGGILKGVSAVFFAYIGFDAISTTAEECTNPQRDLPRGMLYALFICTSLYMITALILTGMVDYRQLGIGDPLAYVFGPHGVNLPWIRETINISALVAIATVLLVFQVGQPRIWMVMSRDGLLPPIFAKIHPKFKTPWFSTLITGIVVAIPSLFMNLTEVTDLTSIGTLFAFILVCGATLRIHNTTTNSKFKTPYINSKYIFPCILLCIAITVLLLETPHGQSFWTILWNKLSLFSDWHHIKETILFNLFCLEMLVLSWFCFKKNLSLIPTLGLASCSYLIAELGITNWIRFGIWLFLGFFIYFLYGIHHSNLNKSATR